MAAEDWPPDVEIRCLPTGLDTPTGGRVHLAAAELAGGTFCLTYADGVADIDLDALLALHAEARRRGDDDRRASARCRSGWRRSTTTASSAASPRSRAPSTGSTAASSALSPRCSTLLTPDSVLEREPLERLAAEGELRAYRHEGFWDCMDTYKDAVALNDLWARGGAPVEAVGRGGMSAPAGRSVLVTGAHGLLGSLADRRAARRGAPRGGRSAATSRPSTALELPGMADRVDSVRGDICDEGLVARALAEYEVDSVFHLAAQTLVGVANRSPRSTFETNVRGTWILLEACREHGVQRGRRRLLGQGLRPPARSCPTARIRRWRPAFPTTSPRRPPT